MKITFATKRTPSVRKSDFLFRIGHSNDKKHTYKNGNGLAAKGSGLLSARFLLVCLNFCFGGKMRATNPIEPECPESALLKKANIYDLGMKQDESGRLRRIRNLEHENALLMRMVSETQMEIARLRELLSSS